jgi:putative endonuclease
MNSLDKDKSESIKQIGSFGERLAKNFLIKKEYRILTQNFHARGGEIDIIAYLEKNKEIVFVEVKTRRVKKISNLSLRPEMAVTFSKKKKIKKASRRFFAMHHQYFNMNYSFDIISVEIDLKTRQAKILHFRGDAL